MVFHKHHQELFLSTQSLSIAECGLITRKFVVFEYRMIVENKTVTMRNKNFSGNNDLFTAIRVCGARSVCVNTAVFCRTKKHFPNFPEIMDHL